MRESTVAEEVLQYEPTGTGSPTRRPVHLPGGTTQHLPEIWSLHACHSAGWIRADESATVYCRRSTGGV